MIFYERDLGILSAWKDTLRTCNPVCSDLGIGLYTRVAVRQAPAL